MGRIPGETPSSEDPLGFKKNRWCRSAALLSGIGAWKTAENCKSSYKLSALYCHKLWITGCLTTFLEWLWRTAEIWRDTATPPAREEQHESLTWESLKFGLTKLSCMPEIKTSDKGSLNTGFWQKPGRLEWFIVLLQGLTEDWGTWIINSKAREWGTTIFTSPISAESLQGTKKCHLVEAGASTYTKPCLSAPCRCISTIAKPHENQCNWPRHRRSA